ncbi:MAG: cytochrome c [Verrucomicrobiales bacterium]|nr:cytochrome c [Verrucomicrobiales bacterium]
MGTILALLLTLTFAAAADHKSNPAPPAALGTPLATTHIRNVFRVTTNLLSGNSPTGEAAFAELARLGVKTIVSVDGGKPEVETARQHGIRYIHLPIGYDGVPLQRVAELTKAAQTSQGPIYIHCHHGLHRGPAAVAVICEATAGWSTNQAVAWLKQAGTSMDYAGLYRSAMTFQPPTPQSLSAVTRLPEIAQASSLVDAMVAIDEEFERLKAAQKLGWSSIPRQPDLTPVHSAKLLWEHVRELLRTDDSAKRPADYRAKLQSAVSAVETLHRELASPTSASPSRDAAFQQVIKSCSTCHKAYRN